MVTINFRAPESRNEWIYSSEGLEYNGSTCDHCNIRHGKEDPYVSVCLHALTSQLYRERGKRDAKLTLFFNTLDFYSNVKEEDEYGYRAQYSNCTILTLDEYNEYIQLVQQYIPKFDYELIKGTEILEPTNAKNRIKITFHSVNYVEFLFIVTMIRYGYEFPSAGCMKDVMQLYHLLNGEIDIVSCVNTVLGMANATHGHQTQCIFPHLAGLAKLYPRKVVLNRLSTGRQLTDTFQGVPRNLNSFHDWDYLSVNLEEMAKTSTQRMCNYLNFINKWRGKYSV